MLLSVFVSVSCLLVFYCSHIHTHTHTQALYFFRVIAVIYGIWTTGMILLIIGATDVKPALSGRFTTIGFMFTALQPIVSTCINLTKSDVRKHVINLTTLTYIRYSYTKSTIASYEENDADVDADVDEVPV